MWLPNYLFLVFQHGEQRRVVETQKGELRNTESLRWPAFGEQESRPSTREDQP